MSLWPMYGAGRKTCRYWIKGTHESWKGGTRAEFAIERKNSGGMLGLAGLEGVSRTYASADLTFLLKVPFWGQGYATEAAGAVVWFGFKCNPGQAGLSPLLLPYPSRYTP